jgi:hypothetical protein
MRLELPEEIWKIGVIGEKDFATAVESNDFRGALESAEKDDNPAVFLEVSDGFHPAAGQVEVGDLILVQDPEGIEALGRAIDMAVARQGRGSDEKDFLSSDP